jgi:hypothetical protein
VNVGIHDVADFHSGFLGGAQIELRLINWVAHGGQGFASSTENIGGSYDWVVVEQLTQDHRALLCKALIEACSRPVATGSPRARQSWTLASRRCARNPRARRTCTASIASAQ